ncbi:type I restriction enzyme HsdR N-terminal domain-containing protein [Bradyrhizobium viridifuturi]|uniref:type I restriction enzyme HsdR N-terminal domain-containing protein n=1 Tax=Bradyrhizobium viridifuturi TaxID=1654716 RepID=UPI000FE13EA3|nr:type I restriction enzyme HsdR N-terminal domain-containing protein [Bradyrhizobium viridifuturi]
MSGQASIRLSQLVIVYKMTEFWSNIPTNFTNEADVELRLVVPLLRALGYEPDDVASKHPVEFREGRVGRKPEADFVCFNGPLHTRDTSLIVVEAKAPGEALPNGKLQGESYAANLRAPLYCSPTVNRLKSGNSRRRRTANAFSKH